MLRSNTLSNIQQQPSISVVTLPAHAELSFNQFVYNIITAVAGCFPERSSHGKNQGHMNNWRFKYRVTCRIYVIYVDARKCLFKYKARRVYIKITINNTNASMQE